jgi:hypothetical protein
VNLAEVQGTKVPYKKSKEYWKQYNQKRLAYIVAKNKEKRTLLKNTKPPKSLSHFQKNKQNQLLKLLVNHRSFVPVPPKLKHPVIRNWNADNYWYKPKIDYNNLERGCVRIYKDNWNNCAIIWLDIDEKGWTKLAKSLRCGYITSPKKHIRIPVPVKSLGNLKTGTLYYQGKKIGDAKLSGEVMLPGNKYYDKKGNFLGYYEYKAWGTFFPFQNQIWANPQELFTKLTEISGIEYQTIKEHLLHLKFTQQKVITENDYTPQETLNIPVKEPPWQKMIIHQIPSQNRQ